MEIYEKPQNRMRKARDFAKCHWLLEQLKKDYTPFFDDDPKLNSLIREIAEEYSALTKDLENSLLSIIDDKEHFRVEIEFDVEKVAASGYTLKDIHKTVKYMFGKYDLPCVVDGPILVIIERDHKDDFSYTWIIIMELIRSDWFLSTVSSFYWIDGDYRENILMEALKKQEE